jgi:hypothetical protein
MVLPLYVPPSPATPPPRALPEPEDVAVLPLMVLFVTVRSPETIAMPPPCA